VPPVLVSFWEFLYALRRRFLTHERQHRASAGTRLRAGLRLTTPRTATAALRGDPGRAVRVIFIMLTQGFPTPTSQRRAHHHPTFAKSAKVGDPVVGAPVTSWATIFRPYPIPRTAKAALLPPQIAQRRRNSGSPGLGDPGTGLWPIWCSHSQSPPFAKPAKDGPPTAWNPLSRRGGPRIIKGRPFPSSLGVLKHQLHRKGTPS
jgi:hypothetical protein